MFSRKRKDNRENQPAEVYTSLRKKILDIKPGEINIQASSEMPNVWGVLMETGYPKAVVTLVSLADGTTSLYFSNGGGMLGGGDHPSVAEASKAFLVSAEKYYQQMTITESFPLPSIGKVKFHILTYSGNYSIDIDENDLGYKRNELHPLFYAGQEVITQFRLAQDSLKKPN